MSIAISLCLWAALAAAGFTADHLSTRETVPDFARFIPASEGTREAVTPALTLERVTTAVPWPRGLAFVDGDLVVLARGRHRRAGGYDPSIEDRAGTLFRVDPAVAEPVVPGELASEAVRRNGTVLAPPTHVPSPEHLERFERPYCTLAHDPASRNLFICGFSGVDLPGGEFRKNGADVMHRFDLRDRAWHLIERHDASVVPDEDRTRVVPNDLYPHHDPAENPAPHGWLNGADGAGVAGRFLYCVAKDNHAVVRYDLSEIRERPDAPPPPSEPALGRTVMLTHPGGETEVELLGPSAVAAHGGHLYLGYRTSSVVVRCAIDADGAIIDPTRAELIAAFEPWSPERGRSANLIDFAFDPEGALYVACATEARIWRVGVPDPARPFLGDDQRTDRTPTAPPYLDLRAALGKKVGCGNIAFDEAGRLYVCTDAYDTDSETLRGTIYRVSR